MNAEDFLKVIQSAMPDYEELKEYGLEDREIIDIQSTFKFTRKIQDTNLKKSVSELERMISEYDCSKIELGLIRFIKDSKQLKNGVMCAYSEADLLIVNDDGSVSIYDHAEPNRITQNCAVDSSCFFDALAEFIDIRKHKLDWRGRIDEAAERCGGIAGGSQYEKFYFSLLSFFE